MNEDLAFAHELADIADEIAMPLFVRPTRFHHKDDGSLVGDADVSINERLVDHIATHRPDDAILSEEAGQTASASRRWIIDPIDGTDAFLAGESHWGTHIALQVDDEVVLAVVTPTSCPKPVVGLERRWNLARSCARGGHHGSRAASRARTYRYATV